VLLRQGYYSPVQATSRRFMAGGEYGYWVEGKPALARYKDPFGDTSVRKGQVRDGGSVRRRSCRISVWNTAASDYVTTRWDEFVKSFTHP
jgi:putative spermidine/putrescine transport system substrate-binding protein